MTFSDLNRRLTNHAVSSIQRGVFSERSLAKRANLSQSHLHNILKGKRHFSFFSADSILEALDLTVQDLIREPETGGMPR